MIKFFRHIRRSLINQNKMGKYFTYAISLIALTFMCFFVSCKQSNKKSNVAKNEASTEVVKQDSLSSNQKWMRAINTKDLVALKELYSNDVYGLSPSGIDFSDRDTLIDIVARNSFLVKKVYTIQRIKANSNYDYEIGSFINKQGGLMKYLVIWDTSQETEKRQLEFLAEASDFPVDLKAIHAQRDKWIHLCNAHNAANLINSLYTPNTMYYNHRPMVVSRENLIPNYAYMNNTDYQLTLHPIIIEPVSESIVYEIGQCKQSYNGKYILIWQKTDEGWQILFDSNI